MKGTIIKREDKDNQVRLLIDDGTDSFWYGCFNKKLFEVLEKGNTIDFAYVQKEDYKNIIKANLISKSVINDQDYYSRKQELMRKGLCLKIASQQCMGLGKKPKQILDFAKAMYDELNKDGWY